MVWRMVIVAPAAVAGVQERPIGAVGMTVSPAVMRTRRGVATLVRENESVMHRLAFRRALTEMNAETVMVASGEKPKLVSPGIKKWLGREVIQPLTSCSHVDVDAAGMTSLNSQSHQL